MNDSEKLEKKIKKLVKELNINIVYLNKHIEFFQIDNNNLYNIINKIDELSLDINKIDNSKEIELNNKEIELKNKEIELLKILQ